MYNITKKEKIKAFLKYDLIEPTPNNLTLLIVFFQSYFLLVAFSIYLMADDKSQVVVIWEVCAIVVLLLATIVIETINYKSRNKNELAFFWFRKAYSMFLLCSTGYATLGYFIFESNGINTINSLLKHIISFSIFMVIFTIILTKVLIDKGFYTRLNSKSKYALVLTALGPGVGYFCANILNRSIGESNYLIFVLVVTCLFLYFVIFYLIKIYYLKKYRFKVKYKRDKDGNRVGYIPD